MAVAHRLTKPCTVIHGDVDDDDAVDEYGNPVNPSASTDTVCYVEQRVRYDQTIDQDTQIEEGLVLLPIDTVVTGHDRIRIDDELHEVVGPPWKVWNPRLARYMHLECRTKRVE